ncbi:MAG: hypothetical protein K6C40_07080, partial [Thermoguttaceae bacterium]|nr:hypothetical protein [Thermoguttaceae bacterium]
MVDSSKLEIQAGKNFHDYQPLIPVLGMLIAGILADSFLFSSETLDAAPGFGVWFWFSALLLSFGLL